MRRWIMTIGLVAGLFSAGFPGQASALRGRPAPAVLPAAPPDMGQMVVFRLDPVEDEFATCNIYQDYVHVGGLMPNQYVMAVFEPGKLDIELSVGRMFPVTFVAGKTQYFECLQSKSPGPIITTLKPASLAEFNRHRNKLTYRGNGHLALPDPGAP